MAFLDSADLLARFNRLTRQGTSTTGFPTSTDIYAFLTEAQMEIMTEISSLVPNAIVTTPALMVTTDGGITYTFASSIFPLGAVQIFPTMTDIPSNPMVPGIDYLMEGAQIRFPNNVGRTFTSGPYARNSIVPTVIDGSTQPLLATQLRLGLVYKAMAIFSATPGGEAFKETAQEKYAQFKQEVLFPALVTQYRNQGAIGATRRDWGRGPFQIR